MVAIPKSSGQAQHTTKGGVAVGCWPTAHQKRRRRSHTCIAGHKHTKCLAGRLSLLPASTSSFSFLPAPWHCCEAAKCEMRRVAPVGPTLAHCFEHDALDHQTTHSLDLEVQASLRSNAKAWPYARCAGVRGVAALVRDALAFTSLVKHCVVLGLREARVGIDASAMIMTACFFASAPPHPPLLFPRH